MMHVRATLLAAALALIATGASAQSFNYDRFKPTTLAEAKADFLSDSAKPDPAVPDKVGESYLDEGGRRWCAEAAYSGRSRPLDADERTFIENWLKSISRQDMLPKFANSYLFTADGKDYWLPVEEPVADFFRKELRPGDVVDLYMAEIGGTHRKDGWAWLPLVEEFRKVEKNR
jgi:hypothetical protein